MAHLPHSWDMVKPAHQQNYFCTKKAHQRSIQLSTKRKELKIKRFEKKIPNIISENSKNLVGPKISNACPADLTCFLSTQQSHLI